MKCRLVSSTPVKTLFTYRTIPFRDLFTKEESNRRIYDAFMAEKFKVPRQNLTGTEGVLFNHGKNWQEQRRFMLTTLRDFGFGKSGMEALINQEVKEYLDVIDKKFEQVNQREVKVRLVHTQR